MISVILALLAGIIIGRLLRRMSWIGWAARLIQPIVGLLLFLMGTFVGAEREVAVRLPELGAQALLLAFLGILGSSCAAACVYKHFFRKGKGKMP